MCLEYRSRGSVNRPSLSVFENISNKPPPGTGDYYKLHGGKSVKALRCSCGGYPRLIIRDEENVSITCTDCGRSIRCLKPLSLIIINGDHGCEAEVITTPNAMITVLEEGIKTWNGIQTMKDGTTGTAGTGASSRPSH